MGKSKKHDKKSAKKKHKHKEHKSKKKCKKLKKETKRRTPENERPAREKEIEPVAAEKTVEELDGFAIPVELMNNKSHAPETPQEYERRQSQLRWVADEATGRTRLIRGDGEVLEEIVSKDRHTEINKKATKADGKFFEANTLGKTAKQRRK